MAKPQLLENVRTRASDLDLSVLEQRPVVDAQNQQAEPSHDVVERFVASVARRGAHVAVDTALGSLTYEELDRVSNQLAHRLISLGVGRESRVGISLPRGTGELVAMLATLKAGAAYVPLDPGNPLVRLQNIIEDATPDALIVHSESPLSNVPALARTLVLLDDLAEATRGYPDTDPALTYEPQQLAYILFTSGSTGRPKGVEITRGAFANFLSSMTHTPGLTQDDRLLAITTTSFDIAGLELFLPLMVGATTVIADRETARDPRLLLRQLETADVSVMQATPATWRLLLEAGFSGLGDARKLRMLCGGEAMSPELARRLLHTGGELWNLYGPTETTVWSTLARIDSSEERITIGAPIDHTQIYVLDEAMQPVAPGQEGELWIGGRGVARGYHGRPELTAERFVQNPRGPEGDRIYRTGDLGRQLPNGQFECMGRLDHQVKIRGFRIELGEIESALRSVPGVHEALVIAAPREEAEPRLLAYWVGPATREALLDAAQRRLPSYMMPSAFVQLPVFPLNSNGKIDRKQLPEPDAQAYAFAAPPAHPETDSESRIAAIWRDVLGLPAVSVDQDFFTLGGNSALAVRVVSRLAEEIGVDFSLSLFFDQPTVRGIAAHLDHVHTPDEPLVVFLRKGPAERPPLWCLFGIAVYQALAHAVTEDRSVVGVHVPFRYLHEQDRQPSIHELALRYVEVLRAHQPHGPYYLLGLCFGGIVAHEVARLLEASGESVGLVAVLDAVLPTAVRVDRGARVREYADKLRHEPRELARGLGRLTGRLGARLRATLARSRPEPRAGAAGLLRPGVDQELPVVGPEIDAEVERFAARPTRLASPLLVVRAAASPPPSWQVVAADMGWGDFASSVQVLDLPADHLGILREPHVQPLAAALRDATSAGS